MTGCIRCLAEQSEERDTMLECADYVARSGSPHKYHAYYLVVVTSSLVFSPTPSFRPLQYRTASDEKLCVGLGTRLSYKYMETAYKMEFHLWTNWLP